jgi:hypothetical protein
MLIVGYVKYHYPRLESSWRSSRCEFKTDRSAVRPVDRPIRSDLIYSDQYSSPKIQTDSIYGLIKRKLNWLIYILYLNHIT